MLTADPRNCRLSISSTRRYLQAFTPGVLHMSAISAGHPVSRPFDTTTAIAVAVTIVAWASAFPAIRAGLSGVRTGRAWRHPLCHRRNSRGDLPGADPAGPAVMVGSLALRVRRRRLRGALHDTPQFRRADGFGRSGELHHQCQSDLHRGPGDAVARRASYQAGMARHGHLLHGNGADRARRRRGVQRRSGCAC